MLVLLTLAVAAVEAQPRSNRLRIDLVDNTVSTAVWGVEQGLPQPSVTELVMDRDGYLWGATFGGLVRFDGRTIKRYTAGDLPVLVNNSVTALLAGPDSVLYFGTPQGTIARMSGARLLDTLSAKGRPPLHGIDAMAIDRGNTLWIRSRTSIYSYTSGGWSQQPLRHPAYSVLATDPAGAVLYAGPAGVVRISDTDTSIIAPHTATITDDDYDYGIHVDPFGRVWVGQPQGLYYIKGNSLVPVHGIKGRVHAITSSPDGVIWVGADRGLYRFQTSADNAQVTPPTLVLTTNSDIYSLLHTKDNVLVAGTFQGLFTLRESLVKVLANPVGNFFIESTSLGSDGKGNVWMTGSCTDLFLLNQQGRVLDSIARPRKDSCVRSVLIGANGTVWMGGDGIIRRRNSAGIIRDWTLPSFGTSLNFARPAIAMGDTVLFGLSDGRIVGIAPNDSLKILAPWDQVTNMAIESMARDSSGSIWVGQLGRLTRWKGMSLEMWGADQGVPAAVPRALLVESPEASPQGSPDTSREASASVPRSTTSTVSPDIWIGTYGRGLWHLKPVPGKHARSVPLVDETVSAILLDHMGRIWMPGNRGISVTMRSGLHDWLRDSTNGPDVRLISEADGVPEGNAGFPAAVMISSEVMAFASVDGLVVLDEARLHTEAPPVAAHYDGIRTNSGLRLLISDSTITLAPKERSVSLTYSVPTYRFADEAQFRYKLEGRDRTWITAGTMRSLQLQFDSPGKYVLHLESRLPGADWLASRSLIFNIQPRWVERVSVRIAFALGLLFLGWTFYRQRIAALRAVAAAAAESLNARREAAEEVARHERALAQVGRLGVAGELTASLSHELGQPLAAIVNNAEVARRMIGRATVSKPLDKASVDAVLRDVVAQGQRASGIVREFRRFLRSETGVREMIPVRELLESAAALLSREYRESQVNLTLTVRPGTPDISVERVLLQQVMVNLLQNALEAVRRVNGASVAVRARASGNGVRVTVSDNGSGFSEDIRAQAFEPFVTSRKSGMGIGLAIARRVIEAHGGHIGIGRCAHGGAAVSFWIPVELQAHDNE